MIIWLHGYVIQYRVPKRNNKLNGQFQTNRKDRRCIADGDRFTDVYRVALFLVFWG